VEEAAPAQPMIEDISDDEEEPPIRAPWPIPDAYLRPDALRQRYELHLPLHPYTHRTRGEWVATLQQLRKQHFVSDIYMLCHALERFQPDAGRFCRTIKSALQLNLVQCPLQLPTAPKVTGYCARCKKRFDVPEEHHLECPVCGRKEAVHLIASRDVAEVLRLALKKGMITTNGGFFKRHDPIDLLMSTAHYGTTSCIILDVLNKTTSSIRIVAAIMHSPMDVYRPAQYCVSSRFRR
jgi:Zn finger protein HypA/HybF involved in hydrogenase expression